MSNEKKNLSLRKTKKNMAKRILVKHLRSVYNGQEQPVSIEDSSEFVDRITRMRSPGIPLAKKNGIAYFVSKGDDIMEIDADKKRIVGRISKSDVKVRQRVYHINK